MQQAHRLSSTLPTLDDWARGLVRAVEATAVGMGFTECTVELDDAAELFDTGASLSLVSEHETVQIDLLGERAPLEVLARTLMMMEDDEELEWADAVDAVSEIVNVVAGAMKSEMVDQVPTLQLGLPIFAETIHHRSGTRSRLRLRLDDTVTTMSVSVRKAQAAR